MSALDIEKERAEFLAMYQKAFPLASAESAESSWNLAGGTIWLAAKHSTPAPSVPAQTGTVSVTNYGDAVDKSSAGTVSGGSENARGGNDE